VKLRKGAVILSARGPGARVRRTGLSGANQIFDGHHDAAYYARADTLSIVLRAKVSVNESDGDGNLTSLEILDASKRVTEVRRIEFETAG
jgi:hypothetical protein